MSSFALSQLPERFKLNYSENAMRAEYILSKYGKNGFKRAKSIEYNPQSEKTRYRWIENVSKGFRSVGRADEIIRLDHKGWFVDNFQDETVHGEVWQLPARNGEPQFVPGVSDPWNNDCACLDFNSITSDKEECARWADSMAECWAEREREYQAKESAKLRLEEIESEIKDAYQDFRRIVREIRASCDRVQGVAVVRELVKDKWSDTKDAIRKLRREQKKIQDYGMEY